MYNCTPETNTTLQINYFPTPWTVAHQAPLPMGFPRQEYWSGLPFPSPGDLPHPGIELCPGIKPGSPPLQADSLLQLKKRKLSFK